LNAGCLKSQDGGKDLMAQNSDVEARLKIPSLPHGTAQLSRICYSCRNSYPHIVRFCPQDGADLEYMTPLIEDLAQDFKPRRSRKLLYSFIAVSAVLLYAFLQSDLFKTSSGGSESGEIAVRTNPPGAVIYLDGSEVGVTPVFLSEVPTGVHYLRAEFPGYQNEGAKIKISPSSKKQLELRLAPLAVKHLNPFVAAIIPKPGSY
jgi:hypothetical protein